ncbi:hypothetical protein IFM89_032194 [Coptis chinensis]|uniref:DUF4283 domain-containing protein n=1 Tax=Coptis chinensis TaxID=261450 RepID=A0A835IWB4_9MAGN|nr:hypothetical protein IFM89_032194 [Coptis chinensis]
MPDPSLVQVGQASSSANPPFSWSSLFHDKSPTFVNEQLEFVESTSVDDVIEVPRFVLEEGIEQWSEFLVGYFVEKRMPFPLVKRTLKRIWKTKANYEISTDKNLFYFKFSDDED